MYIISKDTHTMDTYCQELLMYIVDMNIVRKICFYPQIIEVIEEREIERFRYLDILKT